jgi:hypothetical protein
MTRLVFFLFGYLGLLSSAEADANPLNYKADKAVANGKHIVLIASDHSYRGEETLPALARILARHHGFDCTVLFGLDSNGEIEGGSSDIPGLEALESADLMVLFARFLALPEEQMKLIDAYLNRGGPVMGLRTSTHAFKYEDQKSAYSKYDYRSETRGYENGFGHQVLGQTWVGHYGKNHVQSTRISIVPELAGHPILRGVTDIHAQSGGYNAEPQLDWNILTIAQPLMSMEIYGEPDATKPPMASEWTREYTGANGRKGRVFTSLYGASEDILNPGYRRMILNAAYWLVGLEDEIKADAPIDFVGDYQPNTFGALSYARGVKPEDYDGFETPIPANHNTTDSGRK